MLITYHFRDGKIKEYSNRKEALLPNKETEEVEGPTVLYQESKNKTLADLIYDEDSTADDMDDSVINKLDTTNVHYHRLHSKQGPFIYKREHKGLNIQFNAILDQIDEEYQQKTDFLRSVYKLIIKQKFVTGGPKVEGLDEMMPSDSDEEEMQATQAHRKNKLGEAAGDSDDENDDEKFVKPHLKNQPTKEELLKMMKRDEFISEDFGYFKKGTYVRIEVEVSKKIASYLDPQKLITLCALEKREEQFGYMRVKIKKHRWYPHVLKNKDPLIFSIGWRRFQSIPVLTTEDQNDRMRMLKYTPKFGFCHAVFYGPLYPLTTSFICIQRLDEKASHFRISANGVIVEQNQNFKVLKKLKLIGEPFKILKNTAFVKGMFNSTLEVAKYEGAKLQTVSGIRGQIKKAATQD